MDSVVDGIEVVLLGTLSQIKLALRCAEFAVNTPLEVVLRGGLHVGFEILAEHFGEFGGVFCLFVSGLFPVQADLRIALAVGDAGHAEVHADLRAFAVEVGLQLVEDILFVSFGNVGVILDSLGVNAVLMLGSQGQIALDFLKHVALRMTDGAFCRSSVAFVDVTADFANKFLHDKFLRKIFLMIKLWIDECQCASFFTQPAQTPVTAMRQLGACLPFNLGKRILGKFEPVNITDRAADTADKMRVWVGAEVKAFEPVVDADGIDRALSLEHGEVSIDRRK